MIRYNKFECLWIKKPFWQRRSLFWLLKNKHTEISEEYVFLRRFASGKKKKKKPDRFRIEEKLQIHSRLLFLTWNLQDSSCDLWPKIHKVGNEELHVLSMKTFHMKSGYHNLQWLAKGKGKKTQFFVFIVP